LYFYLLRDNKMEKSVGSEPWRADPSFAVCWP
jgi:hypothetical protein